MSDSDVVREFHSNLWDIQLATIPVRGKMVPFIARANNAIFSLSNYGEDGYSCMMTEANDAIFTQVL